MMKNKNKIKTFLSYLFFVRAQRQKTNGRIEHEKKKKFDIENVIKWKFFIWEKMKSNEKICSIFWKIIYILLDFYFFFFNTLRKETKYINMLFLSSLSCAVNFFFRAI
jgi:hypothetical protein